MEERAGVQRRAWAVKRQPPSPAVTPVHSPERTTPQSLAEELWSTPRSDRRLGTPAARDLSSDDEEQDDEQETPAQRDADTTAPFNGALSAQRQYLRARLTGIHVLHSAAGQAEDPDLRIHLGSLAEQHAEHVQAEWESLRAVERLLNEAEAEPEVQQPHVRV